MEGINDPQAILDKLKTATEHSEGDLKYFAGSAEDMIDSRLTVKTLDSGESPNNLPRAVWNSEENCFKIATEGKGVREFSYPSD